MKALSLTQPWATLVALGEKRIETRSWPTKYRGPIAIHAAKGFPGWAKHQCFMPAFASVLIRHNLSPENLPLGRILCVTSIEGCLKTEALFELSEKRRAFGDYTSGRFAWILGCVVKVFEAGIYARGALGLWNWKDDDR